MKALLLVFLGGGIGSVLRQMTVLGRDTQYPETPGLALIYLGSGS